jgi:hypothetical protein
MVRSVPQGDGVDQRSGPEIKVALIGAAAVVLSALVGLVGALIAAHNPSVAKALGGEQPTMTPLPAATPTSQFVSTPSAETSATKIISPTEYLVDMDWQDYTNTGPGSMVTGLAIIRGKRYPKSFTTGRCWVDEVVVKLSHEDYSLLEGVVGYPDTSEDDRQVIDVEISASTVSNETWTVIDLIGLSQHSPVKAFKESLPEDTSAIRLKTDILGCAPDITWGNVRVT